MVISARRPAEEHPETTVAPPDMSEPPFHVKPEPVLRMEPVSLTQRVIQVVQSRPLRQWGSREVSVIPGMTLDVDEPRVLIERMRSVRERLLQPSRVEP